jgi:hypothetical protein
LSGKTNPPAATNCRRIAHFATLLAALAEIQPKTERRRLPTALEAHHILYGRLALLGDLILLARQISARFTELLDLAGDLERLKFVALFTTAFACRHQAILASLLRL